MDFPFFIDIYYIYIPYKSQVTFFSFSVLRHARYRNSSRLYTLAHVRDMPRSQVLRCYARRYKFHGTHDVSRRLYKRVIADFTFPLEIRVFILEEIIPLPAPPRPVPCRYVVTVYKSNGLTDPSIINRTGSLLRCKCPQNEKERADICESLVSRIR